MSLENEYFQIKAELKREKNELEKSQAIIVVEDENNPFTIEERIAAKERVIKSHKSQIKELEELIAEIKEELQEFIENGGEVSQLTIDELEEINEFEEFDVHFKIESNRNKKIYCEGYVTINDKNAEDVDWHYWTGDGYQSRPFYHHDEADIGTLTAEQNAEIDQFKIDYMEDALWIDTAILQSEEGENKTYVRADCTVIINNRR